MAVEGSDVLLKQSIKRLASGCWVAVPMQFTRLCKVGLLATTSFVERIGINHGDRIK